MRTVDRGGDLRPVTMFSLDRLGQPCIVGAQFGLQRAAADGELLLDAIKPLVLRRIDLELIVEKLVQRVLDRLLRDDIDPSYHAASHRFGDGQQPQQVYHPPVPHHSPPSSAASASATPPSPR